MVYNRDNNTRNNKWLLKTTRELWQEHFSDIPIKNDIIVLFSRRNKRLLGSIKYESKSKNTLIRLNGHFRNNQIPLYVLRATLAHEITHYTHGFSSPRKKMYRYPHQGGVIKKELQKRGLDKLEKESKKWLKTNWGNYINKKSEKII